MAAFCVFLHGKEEVRIFVIILFSCNNILKSCCAIQTSPNDAEYTSVHNMKMQSVILEALITFWIQSTSKKLFECFQESRKSYNCSTSTKSLLLWNQENEYSIFFFHLSPLTYYWFTLFSQQFLTDFPMWITYVLWYSFCDCLWKAHKIRTAATCSLELQTSEHSPWSHCVHCYWRVQSTSSIQPTEH